MLRQTATEKEIVNILDGTTPAGKALRDVENNEIVSVYAKKSEVAAVVVKGQAPSAELMQGAGVYDLEVLTPRVLRGGPLADYDFTSPDFLSESWTLTGGLGVRPLPSFQSDGLHVDEGLVADRGAAAVSNPFYGKSISDGITIALQLEVWGEFRNNFESIFGFSSTPDSANSAFNFFAVTSNGTGVRYNANKAGNLGENYFDLTGAAVADMAEPSMYVMTISASAIKMYCNGVLMADYPFTNGGGNTTYRVSVLSAIAQMQYFVLGADPALIGWGNPYMTVQRAMLYDFAMTEAEVEELFSNGLYLHRVQAGGNICGTAADMAKRAVADGVGNVISETYAKSEDVPDIPTPTSLYNGYFLGVSGGAYALRGVQKTVYEHNVQIVLQQDDQFMFRCTVLSSSPTALTVSDFLAALAAGSRAVVGFKRNTGGGSPSISIIYEAYHASNSELGIRAIVVTNPSQTPYSEQYYKGEISITDNVRAITV